MGRIKLLSIYFVSLFLVSSLAAQELKVESLPSTPEEFIQMREELAKSPEGGAAMFLVALLTFSQSQSLGMQFLTIALDQSNVSKGDVYKGFAPSSSIMYHIKRLDRNQVWAYMPFAYVQGASPENNYQVDLPYTFVMSRNRFSGDESSGKVKVFVEVSGFRPRPMTLKRNSKGIWKALECSSFFLDVAPPKSKAPADSL